MADQEQCNDQRCLPPPDCHCPGCRARDPMPFRTMSCSVRATPTHCDLSANPRLASAQAEVQRVRELEQNSTLCEKARTQRSAVRYQVSGTRAAAVVTTRERRALGVVNCQLRYCAKADGVILARPQRVCVRRAPTRIGAGLAMAPTHTTRRTAARERGTFGSGGLAECYRKPLMV